MLSFDTFTRFHFSKDKVYDGSKTLKMVGSDCKKFELGINKFVLFFLMKEKGETEKSASFQKMGQISVLYQSFKDLAE